MLVLEITNAKLDLTVADSSGLTALEVVECGVQLHIATPVLDLSVAATGIQLYAGENWATPDHNHDGVYEPADSTILKDADIGVTVSAPHAHPYEPADATILKDADIGVTVSAPHSHPYEPADPTILKDADIGDTVAPQVHSHPYEPENANIQLHIADSTVHFDMASIDISESQINDLQAYLLDITGESLSSLSDVTLTTIATSDMLQWDGLRWINIPASTFATAGHNHDATYAPLVHDHDGVYEPADATILKDADIGVNVAAQVHNHAGVYEPADPTILKDADIGVNVAAQVHNHDAAYEPKNVNIQSHIGDATKHFTQAEISITESQVSDLTHFGGAVDDLTDVVTGGLSNGHVLQYSGGNWSNVPEYTIANGMTLNNIGDVNTGFPGAGQDGDVVTWDNDTSKYILQTISITESQISDLGTYIPAAEKAAANGVATLGADSKIPTSQLPALAITDTFVVVDEAAMLALTAETGDVAVRSDENKSYILKGGDPSILGDWQELLTPTDSVLSVNGYTGAVTLTTSDITEGTNQYYTEGRVSANTDVAANTTHRGVTSGNPHGVTKSEVGLGSADNTSDADKPVSTAQQTEIDTKEDDLSNPGTNGHVLSSTIAGVRSWIAKLSNLVEDTTPQLGGNLDVLGRSITSSITNANIVLAPNGTGHVVVDGAQVGEWTSSSSYAGLFRSNGVTDNYMIMGNSTTTHISTPGAAGTVIIRGGNNNSTNELVVGTTGSTIGGNKVWHAGNDGASSGLDADKVDGYQSNLAAAVNTVAVRDGAGDLHCRLLRPTYTPLSTTPTYFAVQHAVGVGTDNYVRAASKASVQAALQHVYGGRVTAAGGWGWNPNSWTVSKVSTGRYRITHNLGTTGYSITAIPEETNWNTRMCKIYTRTSTYVDITVTNHVGGAQDHPFDFMLTTR